MGVGEREGGQNAAHDRERTRHGQGALPPDEILQRLALDVFHHDVVTVAVVTDIVDLDDIGVREPRRAAGLVGQARDVGGIGGELGMQDLDGHAASQAQVLGQVNAGHAAGAEGAQQAVAPVQ